MIDSFSKFQIKILDIGGGEEGGEGVTVLNMLRVHELL